MKFYDGGMARNPFIEPTYDVTILSTFRKAKVNTMSRYKEAWLIPEKQADFIIDPYLGNMGSFGTPDDIQMSSELGYYETKRRMEELLKILN